LWEFNLFIIKNRHSSRKYRIYLYLTMFLNYLTFTLLTITEFISSVILPFLNNYIFEGVTITVIIYLASGSRAAKILDTATKVIGSAAGSTIIYNNWFKGSSSNSDESDKDKRDKRDKKDNKTTNGNQGTSGK